MNTVIQLWVKERPNWSFTWHRRRIELGLSGPFCGGVRNELEPCPANTVCCIRTIPFSLRRNCKALLVQSSILWWTLLTSVPTKRCSPRTPPVLAGGIVPGTTCFQRDSSIITFFLYDLIKSAPCGFQIIGSSWIHSYLFFFLIHLPFRYCFYFIQFNS